MGKNSPHTFGSPSSYMTLHPIPSEYEEYFVFFFISACSPSPASFLWLTMQGRRQQGRCSCLSPLWFGMHCTVQVPEDLQLASSKPQVGHAWQGSLVYYCALSWVSSTTVWPIFGLSADCYWQPVITDEMIRLLWGHMFSCSVHGCMGSADSWVGGGLGVGGKVTCLKQQPFYHVIFKRHEMHLQIYSPVFVTSLAYFCVQCFVQRCWD